MTMACLLCLLTRRPSAPACGKKGRFCFATILSFTDTCFAFSLAAEYLRLLAKAAILQGVAARRGGGGEDGELEALDSVAASMDQVLKRCGGAAGVFV